MERHLRLAPLCRRSAIGPATIVATISGAFLIWVAVGWIVDSGRPGYALGYLAGAFVFAIGLRWIYAHIRRWNPPRRVWSPWLVPLTLVVVLIARN
jgi:apolipoprotein N-acyltransferase